MRGSLFSSHARYRAAHPNEGYFDKHPSPGIQLQCFRQILHWFHDGALCLPFHDGVCVGAYHCRTLPDPATFVLPHARRQSCRLWTHSAGGTHRQRRMLDCARWASRRWWRQGGDPWRLGMFCMSIGGMLAGSESMFQVQYS